jgi:D-alanine-D-alanine ligase
VTDGERRVKVAVLYQDVDPPVIDGIRKPKKPGGYSDSGADITYVLSKAGVDVVTPVDDPDPVVDTDWVFADTAEGIDQALARGATVLWANTIVFSGHPLESVLDRVRVVGQHPDSVHRFDDKWLTNGILRDAGLPVVTSTLIGAEPDVETLVIGTLTEELLAGHDLRLPLILKPLRGRGSQGVVRVDTIDQLRETAHELLGRRVDVDGTSYSVYGDRLMLEQYLPGREITVTVMPPDGTHTTHWPMPAVERVGQDGGVIPYSGRVPVAENSFVVADLDEAAIVTVADSCRRAAPMVDARAPIRVDCRETAEGEFLMFDLNMKPNMTGAGRPGRENQDSLTCVGARALDWSYRDLLIAMLDEAWSA